MERTFLPNHGHELKWSKTDIAFLFVTLYAIIFRELQHGYLKFLKSILDLRKSQKVVPIILHVLVVASTKRFLGFCQMIKWEKPNGNAEMVEPSFLVQGVWW